MPDTGPDRLRRRSTSRSGAARNRPATGAAAARATTPALGVWAQLDLRIKLGDGLRQLARDGELVVRRHFVAGGIAFGRLEHQVVQLHRGVSAPGQLLAAVAQVCGGEIGSTVLEHLVLER